MRQVPYRIVFSRRKTISIRVNIDGSLLVRAPAGARIEEIEAVIRRHEEWIRKQILQMERERETAVMITPQMREDGICRAKKLIPERVEYYAARMGVTWGRITIREQKTRWGSCSSKGNLNFNWKLVLMPDEILDYVVVHELAHRLEMNHSERFWKIVRRQIPDYQNRRRELQECGRRLISQE